MELITPVFTPCQTASLTRKEEGLEMAFTQTPVCFTAIVPFAHRSDHVKHSTMGGGHSVCQLLQL